LHLPVSKKRLTKASFQSHYAKESLFSKKIVRRIMIVMAAQCEYCHYVRCNKDRAGMTKWPKPEFDICRATRKEKG
jgi:hypothetical protein